MDYLPATLAVLVMAAGWFYLFHSRGAERLSSIEGQAINRARGTLRRLGGLNMLLLGALLAVGFYGFEPESPGAWFFVVWGVVLVLLVVVIVLALIDVRLTGKLRKDRAGR